MRVIIIGGGDFKPCIDITKEDYVICADHGYDYALEYNIHVDMLLGDFDSVGADVSYVESKISYPSRKDFSDSELAARKAAEMKPDEVILLGFTGSRLDHSLANLMLLKFFCENGIKACIADEKNEVYYYKDAFEIKNRLGDFVSIIPLTEKISSVTTCGLEYPLCGENLYIGESRGISNVVISNDAAYRSESGEGFIIFSKD